MVKKKYMSDKKRIENLQKLIKDCKELGVEKELIKEYKSQLKGLERAKEELKEKRSKFLALIKQIESHREQKKIGCEV